jgi:multidrug resistance efflux pump
MSEILLALRKARDEQNWHSPFNGQMAELVTGAQVSTTPSRRTRRRSRRASAEAANGHRREQTSSDAPVAGSRRSIVSTPFARSMRSLTADGFRRSLVGMLIAAFLLIAWALWFCLARVTLYEVTTTARLEVDRAAHPIAVPVAGRIAVTRLVLGREVQAGDVLVELETNEQQLQIEEERTRLATLTAQIEGIRNEILAEKEALRQERVAAQLALDEARARYREAEVAAKTAQAEADIYMRMQELRIVSQLEFLRATSEAPRRRAVADALRVAISRMEGEQRIKESDRQVRLERLKREADQLTGQRAEVEAALERPAYEITKRLVRSPVAGRLGEVANVQVGTVVREGDKLGAVVPPGTLKVIADFLPATALGRIRPGQPARLRLEGFPWTQYGVVSARVTKVASELRNERMRVDLTVDADAASPIPFQHGLPGTVEVEVDRVSPATLVLRTAGLLLAAPGSMPEPQRGPQDNRRTER